MDEPRKFLKKGTIISALVIGGIVIIICGAAVQLMGTKSSMLFQTVATSTPATTDPNQRSPEKQP